MAGEFDPNAMITLPPEFFTGPENLTTTSVQDLPGWLKPYVTNLLDRAQLLSTGPYPFPDQHVAGFTPAQLAGHAQTLQYANRQRPMINAADRLAMNTLQGAYLHPDTNPYLQETFDRGARAMTDQYMYGTAPETAANFARAGTFGGSAMNQQQQMNKFGLGENLASLANQIFGGNYQTERQRQYGQQSYMPGILEQRYIGPQHMMDVGGMQQGQLQNVYNTQYQNQYNRANWPFQSLGIMQGALGAVPGGGGGTTTTTSPNPNYASPLAGLIGLNMMNAFGGRGFGGGNTGFPVPGAPAGFGPLF